MGFEKRMKDLRERLESELESVFEHTKTTSLWEPMAHPVFAGGKRIRPLFTLLSCMAVGGSVEDCIEAAVAVELVHTFTLVHDDIMDHDDLRRGKPTVHRKWDEPTAILAGDGLVTLAYRAFLGSANPRTLEALRILTSGLLELCEGQALDKAFEDRSDVSLDEYGDMIHKKTATLLRVSAEIGCVLGDGSGAEREALRTFASDLGRAFQIQDDLLDLRYGEEVTGKPRGSDLLEKKKTFLSIHFLSHADETKRRRFLEIWDSSSMDAEDTALCARLFEEAGTFDAARRNVARLMESATAALQTLPASTAREDLMRIADRIHKRIS